MAIYQLRNLDKWVKKVGGDADKVTRAVALQMTNEVINRTRVDTGRARGNWHAEINHAEENIFEFAGGGCCYSIRIKSLQPSHRKDVRASVDIIE